MAKQSYFEHLAEARADICRALDREMSLLRPKSGGMSNNQMLCNRWLQKQAETPRDRKIAESWEGHRLISLAKLFGHGKVTRQSIADAERFIAQQNAGADEPDYS